MKEFTGGLYRKDQEDIKEELMEVYFFKMNYLKDIMSLLTFEEYYVYKVFALNNGYSTPEYCVLTNIEGCGVGDIICRKPENIEGTIKNIIKKGNSLVINLEKEKEISSLPLMLESHIKGAFDIREHYVKNHFDIINDQNKAIMYFGANEMVKGNFVRKIK